jgi:hypothetical protein
MVQELIFGASPIGEGYESTETSHAGPQQEALPQEFV